MKKIIYHLTIPIAFYLGATCVLAQSPKESLAIQAKENADAMLKKDYETMVRFMYPPVVESMGGFQKALNFMRSSMAKMESQGWTLKTLTVGQPSAIVIEGREDVAIVPSEMVMIVEGKTVRVNSCLVAVTQDEGKNWYFFDGAQMPKEKLSQIYPKLVATVVIPERKNSLVDDINESLRRVEEREGKPIREVLAEQRASPKGTSD